MIIKPGKPVVIAPQPDAALQVLVERCKEVDAEPVMVQDQYEWSVSNERVDTMTFSLAGKRDLAGLTLPFPGEHQVINAATAVTVLDNIKDSGFEIPDKAVREGLSGLNWPARFQRVSKNPDIILDGAHNASSAAYLCQTIKRVYPGKKVTAVIGLGGDKDVEGFLRELLPVMSSVILTRSAAVKAVDWDRMHNALIDFPGSTVETESTGEAMRLALEQAGPEEVVLVTGSFYVVGEAISWLDRT
jgi:dihydrofolate synthase/folylpolyglutamate synthase